jgi:DNA-directed RNA polymerase specialized sigma24 family protein
MCSSFGVAAAAHGRRTTHRRAIGQTRSFATGRKVVFTTTGVELIGQLSNPAYQGNLAKLTHQIDNDRAKTALPRTPRQRQRRLSADEAEALVATYEAGTPINELTALYGIHRETVVRHLDRALVSRRTTPLAEVGIDELIKLYDGGWSLKRIGERFGVQPTSVYYRLRRAGVTMRPRSGWSRRKQGK